jgi:flagellar basal-body rod protein FlgG
VVSAKVNGQVQDTIIGQITIVNFVNEGGLEAQGDNLFLETATSGAPIQGFAGDPGFAELKQGYLESSNVNSVDEITNMMKAQRVYEFCSQLLKR